MDWIQVFTIIGVLGAFMFYMIQRLERDMDTVNKNIDTQNRRFEAHAIRIDQLYRMFVDLVKEGKK